MANIFIVALDELQRRELQTIRQADEHQFHSLLSPSDVVHAKNVDIDELLTKARRQLDAFPGSVDAIVAHWDFPTTVLVPILCAERGLPGPSLRSVLQCSHKYWSRLRQREIIPELTPRFQRVDPMASDAAESIELPYPYWIKPVKGFSSQLGFKIENRQQLDAALGEIREAIHRLGDPFDDVLERVDLPAEVADVSGTDCIVEEYLTGVEVAHEGHVYRGQVRIHGALDMVRHQETFHRYEYPTELPAAVLERMNEAGTAFIRHIGFDNSCFNAEYFWDPDTDKLAIVEVNPRMSQSHAYLWDMVDGASDHEIAVAIALGQAPRVHPGAGRHRKAAKAFLRCHQPGIVERVPSQQELEEACKGLPDCFVRLSVKEGLDVRDLEDQDAYSFELAQLYLAADSREQILEHYDTVASRLRFEMQPFEDRE